MSYKVQALVLSQTMETWKTTGGSCFDWIDVVTWLLLKYLTNERLESNCFHTVSCIHWNKFVHLPSQQFITVR